MQTINDKEQRFTEMLDTYKGVIAKVCCVYASAANDFDDLYQETVINLWRGFDNFRGDSKVSTWIYRAAINTCITQIRRNNRRQNEVPLDVNLPIIAEESTKMEDYRRLHSLISRLGPMEKAIVTLWLDERTYEEIAAVTGLSQTNVAVRLHRIKEKMSRMANDI